MAGKERLSNIAILVAVAPTIIGGIKDSTSPRIGAVTVQKDPIIHSIRQHPGQAEYSRIIDRREPAMIVENSLIDPKIADLALKAGMTMMAYGFLATYWASTRRQMEAGKIHHKHISNLGVITFGLGLSTILGVFWTQ